MTFACNCRRQRRSVSHERPGGQNSSSHTSCHRQSQARVMCRCVYYYPHVDHTWFCGWHILWCSVSKSLLHLASVPERALQSCTKRAAVVDMAFSMVLRPPCVLPPPCPHLRQLQSSRSAVLTAMGQATAALMVGQAPAVLQQQGTCQSTIQQSAHRQRSQRSSIFATAMTTSQTCRCNPQECGCPTVCRSMALCRAAGNSSSSAAKGRCNGISSNEMVQQAAEARAGSWALHPQVHRPMELPAAQLLPQARQQAAAPAITPF